MATEIYQNRKSTTINDTGGISAGDLTFVVTDASIFGWASGQQFRILIEDELLLVTNVATNTLTVTRGAEGTTAASHADGTTVTHVLTRDGLKGIGGSVILKGTQASRPSASVDGKIYLPTDGFYESRDNSSSWDCWGPHFPFVEPDDSGFSWINQLSATTTTTKGGIHLLVPATGTEGIHARVKSLPSAPYTITMAYLPMQVFADFSAVGLAIRESGTGELIIFGPFSNSFVPAASATQKVIFADKWSSPTVGVVNYTMTPSTVFAGPWQEGACMWLRITDDATNRKYYISNDGQNFFQVLSTTNTDFLTADQAGFFVRNFTTSYDIGMTVLSYNVS